MRQVETSIAGEFICDKCGRNSYFSWVILDASELSSGNENEDFVLAKSDNDEDTEDDNSGLCKFELDMDEDEEEEDECPYKDSCDEEDDDEDDEPTQRYLGEPSKVVCLHCSTIWEVCNDTETPHTHELPTTETFQAGEFTCHDCGTKNYFSMTAQEEDSMSEQEKSDLLETAGIEPESQGGFFILPKQLHCKSCGGRFEAKSFSSGT